MARHLSERDRRMGVRGLVKARLAAGWVPLVRLTPDGPGEEEVWAKPADDASDLPQFGRRLTPEESSVLTDIYLGIDQ